MAHTLKCAFSHILILVDISEGGACGYGKAVGQPPSSSMISAGSPLIYQSGKGCDFINIIWKLFISIRNIVINGDGDLKKVELMEAFGYTWVTMQQSWGAVWKYNKQSLLRAPFSIRLTTIEFGKIFVAKNVIPAGWKPG
ncbi:putative expansin-B2 [Cicer arietinum]|uniref:Expansin-B11-like n=1 Tax=Cicer arietinum TaxID=3827 RepID=A0A1S3DWL2_CICAR|nr:expansin-B11-like [Cicer arietinum]